jgi:pimeloyl-ACP methyl ester carboxylesterase
MLRPSRTRIEAVTVGRARVRYRMTGEGPAVVLVHGLSGSIRWWSRNLAALARSHRVYVVNLPGFGAVLGRGRFELPETPTLIRSWMDAVGRERAALVGHSMGGTVVLRTAARHPDVVERLVLVAPAGLPPGRSRRGHLGPILRSSRQVRPRFATTLAADAFRAGPLTLWRAGSMLLAEDVRDDLAHVTAPSLLVWGEQDALVDPAGAATFAAAIPDCRLLLMPGVGHVPMVEAPAAFDDALVGFLAGEPVGDAYGAERKGQATETSGPGQP